MNKFSDPYSSCEAKELTRLQTNISRADHDFLFIQLHPGKGSVTTVLNTLIHKLVLSLNHHGIINPYTQRLEFERFVAEFVIRLPQPDQLPGRAVGRDVQRPADLTGKTPRVRSGSKTPSRKPASVQVESGLRGDCDNTEEGRA